MENSRNNRLNLLTGATVDDSADPHDSAASDPAASDPTVAAGGCCGGGSCGCGSPPAAAAFQAPAAFDLSGSRGLVPDSAHEAQTSAAPTRSSGILGIASVATEFLVTGMTCGHCVSSVRDEVNAIVGVNSVDVVLKKGGASRVTVTSSVPVDADAVRVAVEEAGYQLA